MRRLLVLLVARLRAVMIEGVRNGKRTCKIIAGLSFLRRP
jgi:hypothetical protein